MGEFRVHHVRFFEWSPQSIQCMAYNRSLNKLAVSRSNGNIELWSLADTWYQEEVIPGYEGQSVEDLVWQNNRLFTCGLDGNISEMDLVTLRIKERSPSNAGPVWCLVSNPACTRLAAGSEEGCIVLLDTENGGLDYLNRFDSQDSRILCLAWHPTDDVIVSGGIDNIRLWSVKSGRALQRMTLARQDKNKETVVWCVQILSDMTIVSGDSRGKTTFWNGKQGTVIKALQSHKADVYCLAVDPSENTVTSSGIDSSIVQFNYMAARDNSDWRDWIGSFVHNQHTHDVRAMQIIGNKVVTGGVDTNIIEHDLKPADRKQRTLGLKKKTKWKRVPPLPQRPIVQSARDENLVLLQYQHSLEIWRLGSTDRTGVNGDILPLRSKPVKLVQLKTKGGVGVFCSAISQDATLLAYSDCDNIRAYRLKTDNMKSIQPTVNMSRVSVCKDSPPDGAHCLCFLSSAARLVTVTAHSRLQIVDVSEDDKLVVHHTFPQLSECYHLLSVSPDDGYAAVADHNSNVHLYNLQTKQHICNVPESRSQVSALTFSPDSTSLVMAYTNQKIIEFDLETQEYSDWTKSYINKFPQCWLNRKSKITNVCYNPSNDQQIFLHDEQMFCILDKSQPFPTDRLTWQELCAPNLDKPHAFHISNKYKFLFHLEVLEDNWLLAVERPPLDLYSALPDPLKTKKFGT